MTPKKHKELSPNQVTADNEIYEQIAMLRYTGGTCDDCRYSYNSQVDTQLNIVFKY